MSASTPENKNPSTEPSTDRTPTGSTAGPAGPEFDPPAIPRHRDHSPGRPSTPVPYRYVRTGTVRPSPSAVRPSLRRIGVVATAYLWPDQAEYLDQIGISLSAAVRLAVDAHRGSASPYEQSLTEEEERFREAARYAIFEHVRERNDWLALRATQMAALREACDRHLKAAPRSARSALVAWIRTHAKRYRTLRRSLPEDLAEELGYEL